MANASAILCRMDAQRDFCLVLPTLNEAQNIVPQMREVFSSLPDIGQIFVVDDSSTDNTVENVLKNFPNEIQRGKVKILVRKTNLGLTASLQEAFRNCSFRYIGWMDCDLSMPTPLLREMLIEVQNNVDICIGSRFLNGGKQKEWKQSQKDSRAEIVLSNLLNYTLKFFLRLPVTDFTSGFVIAKKTILDQIVWRGKHGEYFLDFVFQAHRKGAKISELAYSCGTRKFGDSKTSGTVGLLLKNSYRYCMMVLRVVLRSTIPTKRSA